MATRTDARPGIQDGRPGADRDRGGASTSPARFPARAWKDVLLRTKSEAKADHVALLAAGVAFFAMLALVPALVAFVSAYSLLVDPADIGRHVRDALAGAPQEVRDFVESQLRGIARSRSGAGFSAVLGVVVALWSASNGMKHAIDGANAAYDAPERRGFLRLRLTAIAFTVGAVLFVLVALAVVALLPSVLAGSSIGSPVRVAVAVLRWPLLAAGLLVGLAVFYRFAPDRENPQWRWVSPGAILAVVLWIGGSLVFSFYASNFGRFNETYGSLGAIVVVMLWFFLTAYALLLGAELNAEVERQPG